MRIGFASDIHELVENRKLILAGVIIPFEKGEKAHSDGDVVYHALGDPRRPAQGAAEERPEGAGEGADRVRPHALQCRQRGVHLHPRLRDGGREG